MKKNNHEKKMITGVGSALVDMLVNENDDFLKSMGIQKGGMVLVDEKEIGRMLLNTTSKPCIVPGGSACNTVIGIGKLGGHARFIGKRGEDEYGRIFENELINSNVDPVLFSSDLPTGRVLSVITPDAQRSMLTFLGASSETQAEEITPECFYNTAVVHIEGYLLFNRKLMLAVLKAAKDAGALVSLDLASFTVVEQSKDILEKLVVDYVDILIANEDESIAYTGIDDDIDAVKALALNVDMAVLKVGEKGSYIAKGSDIIKVEPMGNGDAVDTTGAGDLWAAGFLYGFVNGYPLKQCGELGSACGYEVCQVMGAHIPEQGWKRIKKILEE